ncbi:DUF58 domain-containing protein [Salisediminibacterium beveridgei]|uniref:DUF58 domain-containing protein n=1 Tax=Salisediminibacterium beveridgei TaxID=632773 RepID=A0A1D7QY97_9BACI|nr:DUF58 domain-containing protein [Salisediminibacterium beveridgei]AOM83982.1 hypothetical protein BBEV_2644 [Salisediminibacterium beveridgei]
MRVRDWTGWYWVIVILRVVLILAIFAGLFSYAMFQGGFVSWFLFYSVTLLMILMLLYTLVPLGHFDVSRHLEQSALPAGEDVHVKVILRRKLPFPFLYLGVNDAMEKRLKEQVHGRQTEMIFYPSFKKELTYEYQVRDAKRGSYQFLGTWLTTSDVFGWVTKRRFSESADWLLVYPDYHHIDSWEAFERHETETRKSNQDFVEDRTSIAGAREYEPGDKLTSIDWKVTARSSKLMTKEFEDYIGQNFMILLSNYVPNTTYDTLQSYEEGIELATSIIMYAYERQLDVGMMTVGKQVHSFSLGNGTDHQKKLVTHLSEIEPDEGSGFAVKLVDIENQLTSGSTVIVIATALDDELLRQLKTISSRRKQIYFFLMTKLDDELDQWEQERQKELERIGVMTTRMNSGDIDARNRQKAGGQW